MGSGFPTHRVVRCGAILYILSLNKLPQDITMARLVLLANHFEPIWPGEPRSVGYYLLVPDGEGESPNRSLFGGKKAGRLPGAS